MESNQTYRYKSPGKERKRYERDDFHGNCLLLCLLRERLHFARHVFYLLVVLLGLNGEGLVRLGVLKVEDAVQLGTISPPLSSRS